MHEERLTLRQSGHLTTFDQTVQTASGSAAASTRPRPRRDGHQLADGHRHAARRSRRRQQGRHLVADLPALHPFTQGGDPSRALQPEDRTGAGRRWVVPLTLQQVRPVDARRHDVRITTSSDRARVQGPAVTRSTSGPPGSEKVTASTGPSLGAGAHLGEQDRRRTADRTPPSGGVLSLECADLLRRALSAVGALGQAGSTGSSTRLIAWAICLLPLLMSVTITLRVVHALGLVLEEDAPFFFTLTVTFCPLAIVELGAVGLRSGLGVDLHARHHVVEQDLLDAVEAEGLDELAGELFLVLGGDAEVLGGPREPSVGRDEGGQR